MVLSILALSAIFIPVFLFATASHAESLGEIQYAQLKEVRDGDLLIRYSNPSGEQFFSCSIDTDVCEPVTEEHPTLFPRTDKSSGTIRTEKKSWDGQYRVEQRVVEEGQCSCDRTAAVYQYMLVDVSADVAKDIAVIPVTGGVTSYKFSLLNGQVVFFGTDGTISVYDIASQKMRRVPATTGLSYHIVSPLARYAGGYNSGSREYRLWNTYSGERITIPAEPSGFFAEFSYDESRFSFLDHDESGHVTLFITDLADWMKGGDRSVERVFDETFVIADYVFLNDGLLYVIGNTEKEPYAWVLCQYNPITGTTRRIRDDVSYGGWIRPIRGRDLQFVIIEGKNAHIALYNSDRDEVRVFRPVNPSPASENIDRRVISVNGIHGVLYTPKRNPSRQSQKLFVWLHGGPMRQASLGYHSFSSYARFDELLERFVDGGSYVLKVDFTGSYGFGRPFMEDLRGQLGKIDVADVVAMTKEVQRQHRGIDETYLIGLSYGGYLGPKALVEHQHLFDGAITINGVFDWLIWLEERPKADSFKKWFNGTPNLFDLEDNFSLYEEASIIKKLPDLDDDKPILIIYGEDDTTIVPAQSRWFFYLAKAFGKDARLLEVADEGHVISRRESMNQICRYITDELHLGSVVCGGGSVE
ncbi:MAG: prolyl oligopeptidase family serine peptidase [Candidatus Kaiserbacteria bacterium]|nr:prolyl oligopeptidase family serine peptidase [Candidatus Kaiserbacteria bacterium]